MRAADVLGIEVVDAAGRRLGRVHDLRVRWDGRDYRLDGLVVGPGALGDRFGYEYGVVKGPWLLRQLVRGLASRRVLVAWDAVAERPAGGPWRLSVTAKDLSHASQGREPRVGMR